VKMRDASGLTLPEMLVALLLGLLLLHLGLESLRRLESARARIAARTDLLVAIRVTTHVMRRELGLGFGGTDWTVDEDSIALRAFRGTGLVCHSDSSSAQLHVTYGGEREPDPAKDSVLLLTGDGRREVRALEAVLTPGPCPGPDPSRSATWVLSAGASPSVVLARLFERGSYHLSGSALRYRRGGGRQPLTPEVFSGSARWTESGQSVGADLLPRDPRAGQGWTGSLATVAAP